jgi:hypothetical protein
LLDERKGQALSIVTYECVRVRVSHGALELTPQMGRLVLLAGSLDLSPSASSLYEDLPW